MAKVKKGVIRLSGEATNSMSVMLMELLNADKALKICYSQLASFILTEFHTRHFERAKPRLIEAHQDKKKCILDKIGGMKSEELDATIKYLEKIKKHDSRMKSSTPRRKSDMLFLMKLNEGNEL